MVKFGDVSFREEKKLREQYKAAQGLSNPRVVIFAGKKPAGIVPSSTGLVKSQGGHFRRKKAPAGIVLSSTGLVKSQGGHFRRKKAPAGIVQSSTGLVRPRPKFGPTQDRQTCHQMGPESSVWLETQPKRIAWPPWFVMSGDQAIRRSGEPPRTVWTPVARACFYAHGHSCGQTQADSCGRDPKTQTALTSVQ